ncbi:MAG: DUF6067 family protein, partial [Victivallales bacterium]|nr:DUF6067 family protein [Victivallales bacterium]
MLKSALFSEKEWEGSSVGITDEVLPPWTPVKAEDKKINVWGRDYVFRDSPFPEKIRILDEEILETPVEICLETADGEVIFTEKTVNVASVDDARAVLNSKLASARINICSRSEIGFDGMIKINLTLLPVSEITVKKFSVRFNFKKAFVSLFRYWPGNWGSTSNTGMIPAAGLFLPFKPFLWLGNEYKGISFYADSDENWTDSDKAGVFNVRKKGRKTELEIKIVQTPLKIRSELQYTFGIQPTPIKPSPPAPRKDHIAHVGYYGMEHQQWRGSGNISLKYPAKRNINLSSGTVEFYLAPMFDSEAEYPDLVPFLPEMELGFNRIFRGLYVRKIFTLWVDNHNFIGLFRHVPDRCLKLYIKKDKSVEVHDMFPVFKVFSSPR